MSSGPGVLQRSLLAAVERLGPDEALIVVRPGTPMGEAANRRQAARRLAAVGRVKAFYLRHPDSRTRGRPRHIGFLAIARPDSTVEGDYWPLRPSPAVLTWATPAPFGMLTIPARLQAAVLEQFTGIPCGRTTANQLARDWRERSQENAA